MSSDERVDRRIWWLTVSKAADRSSRMRTDDLESAFVIRRVSVTESSAVSVECPLLKPDCLASSLLFCERNNETWLKTTRSSVLAMNGRREMSSRQEVKVEHKVSVAAFTSRDEKWVGEGREEDTTEERHKSLLSFVINLMHPCWRKV